MISDCLVILYTFMATVGIFAIGLVLQSAILTILGLLWLAALFKNSYDG